MKTNRGVYILGGCLTFFLLCAVTIYLINPIQIAMRLAGFESEGDTETFLVDYAAAQQQTPIDWSGLDQTNLVQSGDGVNDPSQSAAIGQGKPAVQIVPETVSAVETVTVNVQGQQSVVDVQAAHVQRAEQAQATDGGSAFYAEYTESGANSLVDDLFVQYATADVQQQVRNPRVDLKPGAMVVYAEANLEIGWQEVALILTFNETGTQFQIAGIDIAGQRFNNPPAGFLTDLMQTVETQGNQALQNAQIVTPNGPLNIQQIYIAENMLQIVAH